MPFIQQFLDKNFYRKSTQIFSLVDCNAFYASCERIFNPKLLKKPVVVLSNNDGCIIARSDEAKKLGIKMGEPFFQIRNIIKKSKGINMSYVEELFNLKKKVMAEF